MAPVGRNGRVDLAVSGRTYPHLGIIFTILSLLVASSALYVMERLF